MSELDGLDFDPIRVRGSVGVHRRARARRPLGTDTDSGRDPRSEAARLTRRELLVKGGLGAAALTAGGGMAGTAAAGPARADKKGAYTGTLNVISLGVEWPAGAQDQAQKDLGVKFNVQLMSTNAQVQKSITAP